MNKLLATLVAGLFAATTFAQAPAAKPAEAAKPAAAAPAAMADAKPAAKAEGKAAMTKEEKAAAKAEKKAKAEPATTKKPAAEKKAGKADKADFFTGMNGQRFIFEEGMPWGVMERDFIKDDLAFADVGHFEHLVDDLIGRRNVDDIRRSLRLLLRGSRPGEKKTGQDQC